jgi:hypothetical protein
MKFFAQIVNNKILPEYNSDYDQLKKLKPGVTYSFEIKQPRNVKFHRKFFGLLNLAFDNQSAFNSFEEMRAWIIMKAGFYKRVVTPSGEMYQPESISFASMDDLQFAELYSRVMDVICNWLDISDEDVQEQLINYM